MEVSEVQVVMVNVDCGFESLWDKSLGMSGRKYLIMSNLGTTKTKQNKNYVIVTFPELRCHTEKSRVS